MIKKITISFVFIYIISILAGGLAVVQSSEEDAEKKAKEIHQRASSDVIFFDDELKALYYQNIQIISILKEIRVLLRRSLEKEKEE